MEIAMRILALLLLSAASCSAPSSGGAATSGDPQSTVYTPQEAAIKADLVFRTVAGKSLAGDLYLPQRTQPVPVVIQIHGGGFANGDKAGKAEVTWAEHLTSNGVAAFSVNYRLYEDFADGDVPFDGAVADLKCAIAWLRKNAESYRVDPKHIFVLGGSAGGFMTNFLGTTGDDPAFTPKDCADTSNRVQGVISYFGPADWNALFTDPARAGTANGEKRFLGLSSACTNAADVNGICKSASATTHADANDPPFFVSHSEDDKVVPVGQGRLMKATLEQAKVDVTYRELTGQGHGWHAKFKDAAVIAVRDEVVAWVKAHSQ
jgi:acetyl esterase/lipase